MHARTRTQWTGGSGTSMTSSQYNANGRGHSRCRHHSSAKHKRRHLRRSPSPTTGTATRTATRVGCATRTRFPARAKTRPGLTWVASLKREQLVRSRGGSDHHGMARAWGRAKPCVGRPSGALLWMLGRCKLPERTLEDRPGVCVHWDDCAGRSSRIGRRGTGEGCRMLEGWNEPGVAAYVPALRQTNTGPRRVYISRAVVDWLPLPQLSLSPSHTLGKFVALLCPP